MTIASNTIRTTPAQLLLAIQTALNTFCRAANGEALIATDPVENFNLALMNSNGFRAILHWAGDQKTDPAARGGRVVGNAIECTVAIKVKELAASGQDGVAARSGAAAPLLALVADVRDELLTYRFTQWATPPHDALEYVRCDPVSNWDGLPLAAYRLTFNLYTPGLKPGANQNLTVAE